MKLPKNPPTDKEIHARNRMLTDNFPMKNLPIIPSVDWRGITFNDSTFTTELENECLENAKLTKLADEGKGPYPDTLGQYIKAHPVELKKMDESIPDELGLPLIPKKKHKRRAALDQRAEEDSDYLNWEFLFCFSDLKYNGDDEGDEVSKQILYELEGGDPKIDNLPLQPSVGLKVKPGPDWMWARLGIKHEDTGHITHVWQNTDSMNDKGVYQRIKLKFNIVNLNLFQQRSLYYLRGLNLNLCEKVSILPSCSVSKLM